MNVIFFPKCLGTNLEYEIGGRLGREERVCYQVTDRLTNTHTIIKSRINHGRIYSGMHKPAPAI